MYTHVMKVLLTQMCQLWTHLTGRTAISGSLCSSWGPDSQKKSSLQSNTPLTGHWVALYWKVSQSITSMMGDTTLVLREAPFRALSIQIIYFIEIIWVWWTLLQIFNISTCSSKFAPYRGFCLSLCVSANAWVWLCLRCYNSNQILIHNPHVLFFFKVFLFFQAAMCDMMLRGNWMKRL